MSVRLGGRSRLITSRAAGLRGAVARRLPRWSPEVAIVGAGAGGLATAIRLRRAGVTTFTVYERSDGIGGTWHDNTYPGAQCDVPSHFYSYSFALNPDWSMTYADQPEIRAYLEACADRFGVRPHVRTGCEVREVAWDEGAARWDLHLGDGTVAHADVVVSALGMLNVPSTPRLPGLDSFRGPVFHSARWDHDVDLAGRRVAVVGTGASAVQFVPHVAEAAARTTVFQRSPPWVMPKQLRPYSPTERRRFRWLPGAARRERWRHFWMFERNTSVRTEDPATAQRTRWALRFLAAVVPDEALRARLTPGYPIGCKRLLLSNDWYPALQRPDVELVTEPVTAVTEHGVVDASGREHAVDVIVLGTGFRATDHLAGLTVRGRGGRDLHEEWASGAAAYRGTSVHGYPNLFVLYGPNTNQGGNSIIFVLETQVHHVLGLVRRVRRRHRPVEVRARAQAADVAAVRRAMAGTLWESGCSSYFLDEHGRVSTQYPHSALHYWRRTRWVRPGAYRLLATPHGRTAGDRSTGGRS